LGAPRRWKCFSEAEALQLETLRERLIANLDRVAAM
jgi:hypothetical protein